MRTVFIHGEVEQYAEAKETLIERFGAWSVEGNSGDDDGAPAEDAGLLTALLDDKFVRDGLLAYWSGHELDRFLVEVAPRRLMSASDWSVVPRFLHRWVDFLDGTELLMSGGSSVPDLHRAIDKAAPAYLESMAEPAEWGPAKFWSTTMAEHGVDSEDDTAVKRFFDAVDDGAVEIDEETVDAIEARERLEPAPQPAYWLPPMPVQEGAEADVSATALLSGVRALLEWVGQGRKLTSTGEVATSDFEDLSSALDLREDRFRVVVLLEWAKHTHLIRAAGDRLVRTRISEPLLGQPELLWNRLWDSFVLLDDVFAEEFGGLDRFADGEAVFVHLVQNTLRMLASQSELLPLELLVSLTASSLVGESAEQDELAPEERTAVRGILRRVLEQWELMGVVRTCVCEDEEQVELVRSAVPEGVEPDDSTLVELLPLGVAAVRDSLVAMGFVVPAVEELAQYPAEVLTLAIRDCPPEAGEVVLSAWIEVRGRQSAGAELASLLARVDDPLVRLGALSVLDHLGPEGVDAVRGVRDDAVAGPAARMWLRDRVPEVEVTIRPGDEVAAMLDSMSVVVDEDVAAFLSELQATPTTDQIALVEQIARVPHSRSGGVLEVVAEGHPDSRVASVARRSLEKARGT
ncbi:hypothetical protein [Haloactinomyces albus]|uniref:Uncharacterized protein n=1 Tax=Haloactinomyces albus TaxID=1352928 RepID=A0AAE4CMA2_9ACTN|nr:hypothetical protein [Haloactinomyces albus]MDR7302171.1 hypothetical protein [Haloactinomyces albus]